MALPFLAAKGRGKFPQHQSTPDAQEETQVERLRGPGTRLLHVPR